MHLVKDLLLLKKVQFSDSVLSQIETKFSFMCTMLKSLLLMVNSVYLLLAWYYSQR